MTVSGHDSGLAFSTFSVRKFEIFSWSVEFIYLSQSSRRALQSSLRAEFPCVLVPVSRVQSLLDRINFIFSLRQSQNILALQDSVERTATLFHQRRQGQQKQHLANTNETCCQFLDYLHLLSEFIRRHADIPAIIAVG